MLSVENLGLSVDKHVYKSPCLSTGAHDRELAKNRRVDKWPIYPQYCA